MNTIFCQRLKELRDENAIGQVKLAELCGVSKGTISLWENGLREPTMGNLIKLANLFNVTIDYLVGRVNF